MRFLVIACLLLFFGLGLRATLLMAPTNDEPAHVLRGYVLRTTGDLQFQTGHAPLSHRLIGLLLAGEPDAPSLAELPSGPDGERLQLAGELMWQSGVDVDRFIFLARLPVLWMGLILGGLIGSWALNWHGRGALAVALVLFAASPNLLASAALATTDFVTVVTYFGTIYGWWQTCRRRQWRWWVLTAVFLGLALASKLTAVLLLPVLLILTLLFVQRGQPFWTPFLRWLGLLPVAALVLWLVYGGQIDRVPGWPWPLPAAAYVISWQNVLDHVARGHRAFFMGELSGEGWLSYFPVTFAIKTPVVTLILTLIGLVVIAARRVLWSTAAFLLLPAVALFAAATTSRLNIGYRHILPALPFVLVIASTAVLLLRRWVVTRLLLALALLWMVVAAIRQQPHFLSYFNLLAGGSERGHLYLGDSNLDWGQTLKLLVQRVEHEGGDWLISYAGPADPSYYGLRPEQLVDQTAERPPFSPANPQPGRYAISANHWQGILADADTFDWFRRRPVDETIGGAMLIYDVEAQAEGEWVVHCIDPAPVIASSQAEVLLGRENLRHLYVDCSQSWVLPEGGAAGWYITPQAGEWWPLPLFSAEADDRLSLVYRHRAAAASPSYDVYYWRGGPLQPAASAVDRTATAAGEDLLSLPHAPNDTATLDGYHSAGGDWITFWRLDAPATQPLSLRAHLYGAADAPPQVGDGLGYSSDQWRAGDTLWQRHHFEARDGTRFLETGMYNYQTLQVAGEMLRLPQQPDGPER